MAYSECLRAVRRGVSVGGAGGSGGDRGGDSGGDGGGGGLGNAERLCVAWISRPSIILYLFFFLLRNQLFLKQSITSVASYHRSRSKDSSRPSSRHICTDMRECAHRSIELT